MDPNIAKIVCLYLHEHRNELEKINWVWLSDDKTHITALLNTPIGWDHVSEDVDCPPPLLTLMNQDFCDSVFAELTSC